jgi:hypothetical protein
MTGLDFNFAIGDFLFTQRQSLEHFFAGTYATNPSVQSGCLLYTQGIHCGLCHLMQIVTNWADERQLPGLEKAGLR